MNEVVRVPDIAVCHGGALHSLRGQGVVKSGSLERFEGGSGVVKEGVLYVLEDDWIVSMTTTKIEVVLGMKCDEDMTIDWGDGFAELVGENGLYTIYRHTYIEGVTPHRIVLRGKNTALTYFSCSKNNLTALDVSKNVALAHLSCHSNNNLTALDVSKNIALTELHCFNNNMTVLDVSKNIALIILSCFNNNLTELDVSRNVALRDLHCSHNNLTILDVSKNRALTSLQCYNNNLTVLDVSKNIALITFYCICNNLTVLDVSKNVALKYFYCYDNPFVSDPKEFMAMANTLVDRTGIEAGDIYFLEEVVAEPIRDICTTKNWNITVPQ